MSSKRVSLAVATPHYWSQPIAARVQMAAESRPVAWGSIVDGGGDEVSVGVLSGGAGIRDKVVASCTTISAPAMATPVLEATTVPWAAVVPSGAAS
jgi:hypothetical protein